jgi:hypothetical protein
MGAPQTFYFNEESQISYFWSPREKSLSSQCAVCLLMQLKQPGFKMGFHGGHAVAVAYHDLRQVMYLNLSGGIC